MIPQAEFVANSFVDVVTPGEGNDEAVTESRVKWTRCFSIAMDELAKPLLNGTGKQPQSADERPSCGEIVEGAKENVREREWSPVEKIFLTSGQAARS